MPGTAGNRRERPTTSPSVCADIPACSRLCSNNERIGETGLESTTARPRPKAPGWLATADSRSPKTLPERATSEGRGEHRRASESQRGHVGARPTARCKAVYTGSIPVVAFGTACKSALSGRVRLKTSVCLPWTLPKSRLLHIGNMAICREIWRFAGVLASSTSLLDRQSVKRPFTRRSNLSGSKVRLGFTMRFSRPPRSFCGPKSRVFRQGAGVA